MKYQLHDSQINGFKFEGNAIVLEFSQGYWTTDECGKMREQLKNCKIVFEIDMNDVSIKNFITFRISKKGGVYKTISLEKFMGLLKKSPFNVYLEYNCEFAGSKMLQLHSNHLRVFAEMFIEGIKKTEYIHD